MYKKRRHTFVVPPDDKIGLVYFKNAYAATGAAEASMSFLRWLSVRKNS